MSWDLDDENRFVATHKVTREIEENMEDRRRSTSKDWVFEERASSDAWILQIVLPTEMAKPNAPTLRSRLGSSVRNINGVYASKTDKLNITGIIVESGRKAKVDVAIDKGMKKALRLRWSKRSVRLIVIAGNDADLSYLVYIVLI
jgi:hypothetical protein